MPTNLSMFQNAFMQPKSVAEYANDFGQIQNNALARTQSQMQIDAAKRATQQEDAYNQLAKGFGTDIQSNVNALRQGGLGARADTYLKAALDAQEKAAKTSKDMAETEATKYELRRTKYENGIKVLVGSQTPQDAIARINKGVTDGAWSMQEAQQKIGEIPQDPNQFQDWRQRELLGIVSAKDQIDHALQQQQLDETVRHNTTSEGIMERNNIRSNKRMIGNGGGGGVAMSKPFELTGEDGQQVVVQQDKQGHIRPVQGFSPKPAAPNAAQQKELMSINQQRSIVNGALNAVTSTPGAFTFKRGVAGKLPFGETLAGRTETPQETQARAYVFNNVSRVINERAGAAQSAQELARLNSFLPADTDGPEQIKNKLNGFITYLNDIESGTRGKPTQAGGAPQMPTKPAGGAKFLGYE